MTISPYFEMLSPTGQFEYHRDPKDAKACVVCLHGYSGSPWETKPVAEALYKQGFAAYCPLYPAHGIKDINEAKKVMSQISADQLISFCTNEIQEKRKQFSKVFLFGQSLGGILTYYLTSQGLVDASAVTVGPLKLPFGTQFIGKLGAKLNITVNIKKPPMERGWSYEFLTGKSSLAVFDAMKLANANIHKINVPLLACYSKKDFTTSSTPKIIQSKIDPKFLELQWFNRSGHVMPLDCQGPEVVQSICSFFEKQLYN
jgi:carboxylesterase